MFVWLSTTKPHYKGSQVTHMLLKIPGVKSQGICYRLQCEQNSTACFMVVVLSFLFWSIAWLKNTSIPQFWQLLTDTSIEYKPLWVQVPKLPNGEKQEKKAFIQLEKRGGFAQYLKTTRSEDSSLFCFISFYNGIVSDRRYSLLCQMWRKRKDTFGDNKLIALFQ